MKLKPSSLLALLSAPLFLLHQGAFSQTTDLDALHNWHGLGITSYSMIQTRNCECRPPYRTQIKVCNNRIVSAYDLQAQRPVPVDSLFGFYTIDSLFRRVQDARSRNLDMSVRYNDSMYYPESLFVDYLKDAADDELIVKTEAVAALDSAECADLTSSIGPMHGNALRKPGKDRALRSGQWHIIDGRRMRKPSRSFPLPVFPNGP